MSRTGRFSTYRERPASLKRVMGRIIILQTLELQSSISAVDIVVTKSSFVSCGVLSMLTSSLVVLNVLHLNTTRCVNLQSDSHRRYVDCRQESFLSTSEMYHLTHSRSLFPKCVLLSSTLLSELLHRNFRNT